MSVIIRVILGAGLLSVLPAFSAVTQGAEKVDASVARLDPNDPKDAKVPVLWYDIRTLGVEGQGWHGSSLAAPFDRLPARAEKLVRKQVWDLSRHSAGLYVRFITDSETIYARWKLISPTLAMAHMPATGVSGVDLYARMENGWHWIAIGQPQKQSNSAYLARVAPGKREYLLYLPLYNGVSSVEIGLLKPATLWKAEPYPAGQEKPIVVYGTSITQGGCAARPGMVHTSILQRRLGRPIINLGFSGNGRLEVELAELLGEIDAEAYVIDCLPNLQAKQTAERAEPFVRALRKQRPQTPILLVEDRTYSYAILQPAVQEAQRANRAALHTAFDNLVKAGVLNLHYLGGENLLGKDGEDTVDGSHPTDLGFVRYADAFEPAIKKLLRN